MNEKKVKGRDLLYYFGSTIGVGCLTVGTFFSASAGIQSISEDTFHHELLEAAGYYRDNLILNGNDIVYEDPETDSTEVVAGYVNVDTNTMTILDSANADGITDSGSESFSVNFAEPLGDYIFKILITDDSLRRPNLRGFVKKSNCLELTFDKPCSGIIYVHFFKSVLTQS
ncbi:hypothetical protein [Vibrio sp. C8]